MSKIKTRGFTLIELLVVIAIIGVLSSIVLASLNNARTKARDSKRAADIKQLQLALEMYYDDNGSYPATIDSTTLGSYMSVIPADPLDDSAYVYSQLSSGTDYHLGANLELSTSSVLDSDNDVVGDGVTDLVDGDDGDSCSGAAGRYCYDVMP